MDDDAQARRRRGAGVVTPNACTECRKKRSKCDGQRPCHRCVSQNVECVYAVPVRQSKENMRTEIEQLTSHRQQAERVLSAISAGSHAQETLNRVRNGESLESISHWLESLSLQGSDGFGVVTTFASGANTPAIGQTLRAAESSGIYIQGRSLSSEGQSSSSQQPFSAWNSSESSRHASTPLHGHEGEDAMNWTSDDRSSSQNQRRSSAQAGQLSSRLLSVDDKGRVDSNNSSIQSARGRGQRHILGPSYAAEDIESPGRSWTNVTSNRELVEHLMALYFCWEYPTFASLSKEHFLTDFLAGRPRYCSSILVNSMLALGCRFSTLSESRSDPNDRDTSGDHYFAEAKRLLAEDDHKSLTTIQALGLIAIREASYGRDTESYYYATQAICLAVEFGLHLEVTDLGDRTPLTNMDQEVRAATFWGAFALDEAWSLTTGKIPHFSRYTNLVSKPLIVEAMEASEWVAYTDQGTAELKAANQPSNVRSVYKCFCELSELVHQSLYTLYTPVKSLTSSEILSIYNRYINWYNDLPPALRLGINFTPSVLFVHMYYHFAILMLFRPFIKLRFIGTSTSPSSICAQAADAVTALVRSYDQLYTLQRTPSFVPYIVLAAGITHLALGRESTTKQILQSVHDLKDMCSCHGFAQRGLNIIRVLSQQWGFGSVMSEIEHESEDSKDIEKLKNLCRPMTAMANVFCPDMGELWMGMRPKGSLLLFGPFPMQGLPLLGAEEKLDSDGFARI